MSGVFLLCFAWGAILIFLIGIVYRILAFLRLPLHLRWEVAPTPHEKEKESYGGSYLENYEWWKEERKVSRWRPLIFILEELLLFRRVRQSNPYLWPFTFAMHLGIYIFIGSALLLSAWSVGSLMDVQLFLSKTYLNLVSYATLTGFLLGAAGSTGLLVKRFWDEDLRWSNDTGKLFNLLFLVAVFVSGSYAWVLMEDGAAKVGWFIRNVMIFDRTVEVPFSFGAHLLLLLAFCAYLPFSSMSHFIGKYFTFHKVLWDDLPLNSRMERDLLRLLSCPVAWAAKHAHAGKGSSWIEVVEESGYEKTHS